MNDIDKVNIVSQPIVLSKTDMLSRQISYMDHVRNSGRIITITVEQALNQIRMGSISKYEIEQIRNDNIPENVRKEIKGDLPGFIFSGLFSYRNKSSCTEYQYQSVLDFDDVSEAELAAFKAELNSCPYVFAYWTSPGGLGVKAIVPFHYQVPLENMTSEQIAEEHKIAYSQFDEYLKEEHPLCALDVKGSDLPRFCYDSYDPELVIKDEVREFDVIPVAASNVRRREGSGSFSENPLQPKQLLKIQRKANPGYRKKMKSIIKFLEKRELSITETYRTWYLVGQAIANSFSYPLGLEYYLRLCKLDKKTGKYDEQKSLAKLAQCYSQSEENKRVEQVKVRTIMRLASDRGWEGGSAGKKSREEKLDATILDESISF